MNIRLPFIDLIRSSFHVVTKAVNPPDLKKSGIYFLLIFTCFTAFSTPKISFFCELPSPELIRLFNDTLLLRDLKQMDAEIRLGILDFDVERVEVVQRLNNLGIPVVAWLLLPMEDGYWINMNNAKAASERYDRFSKWSKINQLEWKAVGLDFEPDINELLMWDDHKLHLIYHASKRLFDKNSLQEEKQSYQKLIRRIWADGYRMESYVISFILDERQANTTSFQKLTGILDVMTNKEIPMLYSSYFGSKGPGYIVEYGKLSKAIAIGSTGGGVHIEGIDLGKPLSWEQFSRDLLLAGKQCEEVHIFSLEGCVHQGFIPRIKKLDLTQKLPAYQKEAEYVRKMRTGIQLFLKALQYPVLVLIDLILIVLVVVWILVKLVSLLFRN